MGPSTETKENQFSYYKKVRTRKYLRTAWQKVYKNGIRSKSLETRNGINEFNSNIFLNLDRIYKKLLRNKFDFSPAVGVPIRRNNKLPRPLVVSEIEDRVVQRSILDVLQEENSIEEYINTPYSFGGIKDIDKPKGVSDAVNLAQCKIKEGASWYIKSDIKDFFTKIPKEYVTNYISSKIKDDRFINLFKSAINVELSNLAELGKKANLFPIYEIGVAQGCCLSPLLGNVLLHNFDSELNDRGITCIRYIDDFIILGPTKKKVVTAFENAKQLLSCFDLEVYDPITENPKAILSKSDNGINFLGCFITIDNISPSQESKDRLLNKIDNLINESSILMNDPISCYHKKRSFVDTLKSISNILEGWGNQYSYCNDLNSYIKLDTIINKQIFKYLQKYRNGINKVKKVPESKRRILGVHLLIDCITK